MPQQIIIQLPEGRKLYFSSDARTRLAEISAKDKIATMTADTFKSTLGSLGDLVKILEDCVGNLAKRTRWKGNLAQVSKVIVIFGFSRARARPTSRSRSRGRGTPQPPDLDK